MQWAPAHSRYAADENGLFRDQPRESTEETSRLKEKKADSLPYQQGTLSFGLAFARNCLFSSSIAVETHECSSVFSQEKTYYPEEIGTVASLLSNRSEAIHLGAICCFRLSAGSIDHASLVFHDNSHSKEKNKEKEHL